MSKNTGLGKGLGAIFSGDVTRVLDDIQNGQQDERVQEQTRIPVSEIRPNPYPERCLISPRWKNCRSPSASTVCLHRFW